MRRKEKRTMKRVIITLSARAGEGCTPPPPLAQNARSNYPSLPFPLVLRTVDAKRKLILYLSFFGKKDRRRYTQSFLSTIKAHLFIKRWENCLLFLMVRYIKRPNASIQRNNRTKTLETKKSESSSNFEKSVSDFSCLFKIEQMKYDVRVQKVTVKGLRKFTKSEFKRQRRCIQMNENVIALA